MNIDTAAESYVIVDFNVATEIHGAVVNVANFHETSFDFNIFGVLTFANSGTDATQIC